MAIARIGTNFTTNGTSSSSTSLTYAYTVDSGSDKYLAVFVSNEGGNTITGVTANGTSMSLLKSVSKPEGYTVQIYGLASPTTGNIVITRSNSLYSLNSVSAIYTGVKQTGQPDATNSTSGTGVSNPEDTSITTVADNCLALLGEFTNGPVASTNTTDIGYAADANKRFFDSSGHGAITPAGSFTMSTTNSGGGATWGTVIVSLAPVAAAASGPANLKSRSGNLTANIKSASGNLIANMKSLSGNA